MEESATHATVEVPSHGGSSGEGAPDVISVAPQMLIWTWVTFGLVCFVLYKVAWKPILAALDKREATIRQAQEDAERIKQELLDIEQSRKQKMEEAEDRAKELIGQARDAAAQAAQVIEQKAREESQRLIKNAGQEIQAAQEKAIAALRREAADLSISLAGKLIEENLDNQKNRVLVDKLINKI